MFTAGSVPVVKVADFLESSRHGGSRSIVVRADDGRPVLVKLKGNPQSTRALVGDLVGTLLGRRVGAAFPEPVLVLIRFDDIVRMPALSRRPWIPGCQFGTVFHPDAVPLRHPREAPRLTNLDRLPVTALVEIWIHNVDLKGSHVLSVDGVDGPRLLVVDHGHILPGGPAWTPADLRRDAQRVPDVLALTRLARAAGRQFDFGPAVDACESVGDGELAGLLREVPAEWGLRQREAEELFIFLARRRARLAGWAARLAAVWNA